MNDEWDKNHIQSLHCGPIWIWTLEWPRSARLSLSIISYAQLDACVTGPGPSFWCLPASSC